MDIQLSVILLVTISLIPIVSGVMFFFYQRRKMENFRMLREIGTDHLDRPLKRSEIIEILKTDEEIDIRLLTEIYDGDRHRWFGWRGNRDKVFILHEIQNDLRLSLKEAIRSKEFNLYKNKILKLLDQAEESIKDLMTKKPFSDLKEPEKSLLIDIMEYLPKDGDIPKQKLKQVSDLFKHKYDSIEELSIKNEKSAFWTKWGAFGTVFFGLLSLALSIYSISQSAV